MPDAQEELNQYREQVVERLQYNYAHGELNEEEFEELLSIAINATSKQALVPVESTLIPLPGKEHAANSSSRPKRSALTTIFGGTERKGVWNVPENLKVTNIFGGTELNLSQCPLGGSETRINLLCVMGGVEIVVPDNASVEVNGTPIFGGIENSTAGYNSSGPKIHISGLIFFGGVEVRYMSKKERRRLKSGK